jgi:hypothetical protein
MELLRYLLIVQMDVVMLVVCGDTENKNFELWQEIPVVVDSPPYIPSVTITETNKLLPVYTRCGI